MTTQSAVHQSGTERVSSSIGVWLLGACVSLLTVTAFVMMSLGMVLGLVTLLALPGIVSQILIAPIAVGAVWIAIWMCFRVVEVETRLARGQEAPDSTLHLLQPWITSVRGNNPSAGSARR